MYQKTKGTILISSANIKTIANNVLNFLKLFRKKNKKLCMVFMDLEKAYESQEKF